eukprot:3190287-Amphidinium_carterae.1
MTGQAGIASRSVPTYQAPHVQQASSANVACTFLVWEVPTPSFSSGRVFRSSQMPASVCVCDDQRAVASPASRFVKSGLHRILNDATSSTQ